MAWRIRRLHPAPVGGADSRRASHRKIHGALLYAMSHLFSTLPEEYGLQSYDLLQVQFAFLLLVQRLVAYGQSIQAFQYD